MSGGQCLAHNCFFAYTGENNVYMDSASQLNSCYCLNADISAIQLQSTAYKTVTNCFIRGWGQSTASSSGIFVWGDNNVISGCLIDGATEAYARYGIRFATSAANNIVSGTQIIRLGTDSTPYSIYDQGDYNKVSIQSTIAPNAAGTYYLHNGIGAESANAETPQGAWNIGSIVKFTDSGDGSGDGTYIKDTGGTWVQLA